MSAPPRLAPEPSPVQYRVLRVLKVSADTVAQPGEIITVGADWPYHRAADLARQRYLEPIAPQGGPARKERNRG